MRAHSRLFLIALLFGLGVAFSPVIAAMMRLNSQAETLKYFTSQLALMADGGEFSAKLLAETTRQIQKLGVAADEARKLTLQFSQSGMSSSFILDIAQMAKDLSKLTGETVPESAKKLSKAFTGTVDDVRELDVELKFLTASQLAQIRAMDAAGDRAGALRLAQDILRTSLVSTRTEQSTMDRSLQKLGNSWDKLVDTIANSDAYAQNETQNQEALQKAAEKGHADAQYNLGVMYALGWGVAEDKAEAVSWCRKAAEQGHAKAQFVLGVMYDTGQGVAKNDGKAVHWYQKAAEQGHSGAQDELRKRGLTW